MAESNSPKSIPVESISLNKIVSPLELSSLGITWKDWFMKELLDLLGDLPGGKAQQLIWWELLRATAKGGGLSFKELAALIPVNKGTLWANLEALQGRGLVVVGISQPDDQKVVGISQPESKRYETAQTAEIIAIIEDFARVVGKSQPKSAPLLKININKSVLGNSSLSPKSHPQAPPEKASPEKQSQGAAPGKPPEALPEKGPVLSDWFKEIDYKRLERKAHPDMKEFGRVARLEQTCFNAMFGGYYKTYGADPFLRTLAFCEEYVRCWEEYFPRIPCQGDKAILGKKFTDSAHWHDLVEARRQADQHNARYDEWCQGIFKYYRDNPLPKRTLPTPRYFKTAKAAEHYGGYYSDLYLGGTRDLNHPIWSKEEHDLTCPIQLTAYQTLGEELKIIARQNNRPPYRLFEEAIRSGAIPLDYVKKHYKTFYGQLDLDSAGEIKKSLVEEMGL